MKKSFFLLVPAAFGLLMMSACSDDSSAAASNSNQSSCALNPSETGLEINCNGESYGFLKTSSKGVYGSCGAEALKDDSGYKLVCGGDSVGVVYNGIRGRNGENGTNGQPGPQGEQGADGSNGAPGASCRAEQVATGFDLYCGEEKVGTIANGANGYSCKVVAGLTTSTATISCEDGSSATLNAVEGVAGENCTTSGLRKTESSLLSDFYGRTYSEITCDGETIKVYDGANGAAGLGCTVSKEDGVATITCEDGTEETVSDGVNGDNCSIGENLDTYGDPIPGTAKITCGTGKTATTYIVKDGTAGKNGDNCSIKDNENGTATITCGTGTGATTYTVNDGAKGDAGYSCSSTAGVGYVDVKCQTGVDEETGDPTYETNRILAAGYATCGTGATAVVYNTLTDTCDGGEVLHYTCGKLTTEITEGNFCYEGQIYEKAKYLTETTEYPVSDYGSCEETAGTPTYYNKFVKACVKAYEGEDPASLSVVSIIGVCGTAAYDARESFCAEDAVTPRCGTEKLSYNPASYNCEAGVVTAIAAP